MDVRDKLVEIIQNSVGGCARHWAEVIADGLIFHGVTVQENCKACAEATQNCIVKLQEQIAELRSAQEWISVKDRLPDKRGEYLCYYKFEPDSPDVVCENTYQGSGLWLSEMDKVTYWMEMPQPPKGE